MEAVGPLLALSTWPDLRNGLWLHFVDNTSAQGSLIKGSSSVRALNRITFCIWGLARRRELYLWVERVASKDNPIDSLSRRDAKDHYRQDWEWDDPCLPVFDFGDGFSWASVL